MLEEGWVLYLLYTHDLFHALEFEISDVSEAADVFKAVKDLFSSGIIFMEILANNYNEIMGFTAWMWSLPVVLILIGGGMRYFCL